jgi:hypothetical protein
MTMRKFLILFLALGCSGPDFEPEQTQVIGVCEPRETCDAAGYAWVLVNEVEVGACTQYAYACASATSQLCEERWETVCPDAVK